MTNTPAPVWPIDDWRGGAGDFARETDGLDHGTGAPGVALFANAVQVWSVLQEAVTSVAMASRAFNVVPARIIEAVEWHPWMFLAGPHDDYDRLTIEHEGE